MNDSMRSPYLGYDVLDKWSSPDWDDQTREVVGKRLFNVPEIRFFTDVETRTLEAVAERIVPQPDRSAAERSRSCPGSTRNCTRTGATVTDMTECHRSARHGGAA